MALRGTATVVLSTFRPLSAAHNISGNTYYWLNMVRPGVHQTQQTAVVGNNNTIKHAKSLRVDTRQHPSISVFYNAGLSNTEKWISEVDIDTIISCSSEAYLQMRKFRMVAVPSLCVVTLGPMYNCHHRTVPYVWSTGDCAKRQSICFCKPRTMQQHQFRSSDKPMSIHIKRGISACTIFSNRRYNLRLIWEAGGEPPMHYPTPPPPAPMYRKGNHVKNARRWNAHMSYLPRMCVHMRHNIHTTLPQNAILFYHHIFQVRRRRKLRFRAD